MNGGFGMKKDLMRVSNPQECSLCKRIFFTPQDLISHSNAVHSRYHFATFPSSAAPAPGIFRHNLKPNRNPNPAFEARNRFDLNYYRTGHMDEQGRFLNGSPATTPARNTNVLLGQQEMPKLMDLFPATSSEGLRTLPLLTQLEKPLPERTVTAKGGATSSSIDLTLRL